MAGRRCAAEEAVKELHDTKKRGRLNMVTKFSSIYDQSKVTCTTVQRLLRNQTSTGDEVQIQTPNLVDTDSARTDKAATAALTLDASCARVHIFVQFDSA